MRVSQKGIPFRVASAAESPHPVRLKLGGLIFGLTTTEAIQLANDLADAVETSEKPQTGEQPQ